MQLCLRPAGEVDPVERRDERRALADLRERLRVEHDELFLDAERERRRPLAEPRFRDHYCARTPWTGRPAAIQA